MAEGNTTHLLTIKLDGPKIKPGRIPLSDLVALGDRLMKAIERSAMILGGKAVSLKRGRRAKKLREPCALDLVSIGRGSVTLGFERTTKLPEFDETDPGLQVIEKSIQGLNKVVSDVEKPLPPGFDEGVLLAWRDVGKPLLSKRITKMEFTLNHKRTPLTVTYNKTGFNRIQKRIRKPVTNQRTIEGRLLMADFKEEGPRIRVHPSIGKPVICYFKDSLREEVYENILHFVEVTGEANINPQTGEIISIKISDVNRLESKEDELTDKLPSGSPLQEGFWSELSLEELAEAQGVKRLTNIEEILGKWPGDENEGDIAEEIRKWRAEDLHEVR